MQAISDTSLTFLEKGLAKNSPTPTQTATKPTSGIYREKSSERKTYIWKPVVKEWVVV